jgi:hypothetical protein
MAFPHNNNFSVMVVFTGIRVGNNGKSTAFGQLAGYSVINILSQEIKKTGAIIA